MFGNHFYHETTRRYVAVFGTLFNDIEITRKNNAGTSTQKMKVPINYAPMQKLLAKLEQDPNLNSPNAITLPRMSFEITGMNYSAERKLTSLTKQSNGSPLSGGGVNTMFTPAPYDIEFQLNIMTKYNEDGMKIIEQILPFFKPDCTVGVQMVEGMGYVDIPVVLNSVSQEDSYEADFQTRRALIWTLNFTMKGYFFSPTVAKKQIKFSNVNMFPSLVDNTGGTHIEATPTVPVAVSQITAGVQYQIYDMGTVGGLYLDNINLPAVQAAWNLFVSGDATTGVTYKVGDTFTAPANPNTNPPAGATATLPYSQIDEEDNWKAMTIISDGDGTI
jgi:hypothetical protein